VCTCWVGARYSEAKRTAVKARHTLVCACCLMHLELSRRMVMEVLVSQQRCGYRATCDKFSVEQHLLHKIVDSHGHIKDIPINHERMPCMSLSMSVKRAIPVGSAFYVTSQQEKVEKSPSLSSCALIAWICLLFTLHPIHSHTQSIFIPPLPSTQHLSIHKPS